MTGDLFELANRAPLDAAKQCRSKIAKMERGYHAELHRCIAEGYAVAHGMVHDSDSWREFTKEPFWKKINKRPRAKHQEKALLYVMVYLFDATGKNAYDRAWKYATALQKYFNEGVKPGKIEEIIKENKGIEALVRSAQKARKLANEKERSLDDPYFDLPEKDPDFDEDEGQDGEATKQDRSQRRKSRSVPKKAQPANDPYLDGEDEWPFDAKTDPGYHQDSEATKREQPPGRKGKKLLRFSASRKIRKQLLDLDDGQKARITIRRDLWSSSAARIIKLTPLTS